jgi:hypothetical protein
MNFLGQHTPVSGAQIDNTLSWAEVILNRLHKASEFANDLAETFTKHELGRQFKLLSIMHVPGRSLKVLCSFSDENFYQSSPTIILVKFHPETDYRQQLEQEKAQALNPNRIALLDQWCAVAKLFPEDSALPHLEKLLDLPSIGNILNVPESAAKAAHWKLLSYQEGRRCTLLYHYNLQMPSPSHAYVGKLQLDPEETVISHQRLCQLWDNPERKFNMPKPIACDERHGLRFERFCPGESIEFALQSRSLASLLNLVVTHLIALHRVEISGLESITPSIVLNRIKKKILPRMHIDIPDHAIRAEAVVAELQNRMDWVRDTQQTTLHGDFHIANFLIHEGKLTFIDMDDLANGDPCFDLALFASRLLLRNLQNTDGKQEATRLVADLPFLYSELGGNKIHTETFAWYMTALLVGRQIKVCMRTNAANKDHLIHQLLSSAEHTLANGYFSWDDTV